MFDKAIAELDYIERLVEPDIWDDINKGIAAAKEYIEEGRSINGQLRDTCSDIADEKNGEISDLNDEIENMCHTHKSEINQLQEEIYRLQEQLDNK